MALNASELEADIIAQLDIVFPLNPDVIPAEGTETGNTSLKPSKVRQQLAQALATAIVNHIVSKSELVGLTDPAGTIDPHAHTLSVIGSVK